MVPLVGIMAREWTAKSPPRPDLYDDARQEGLVAVWRVLTECPESSQAYVSTCARHAVIGVVRGRPSFGAPSHRGRHEPLDSAEHLDRGVYDIEPADLRAEAYLYAADINKAVRLAVATLPLEEDRYLVYLRYWLDLGFADAARILGRPEGTLSRRWTENIRPVLRERLAPLLAA